MNNLLVAGLLAAAMTPAAFAGEAGTVTTNDPTIDTSGFMDVYYSVGNLQANGIGVIDTSEFGGRASGTVTNGNYGFQGDFTAWSRILDPDIGTSLSASGAAVTAHAFFRDPSYLVGFATAFDRRSFVTDFDSLFAGIEGQAFLDDLTLYGQIGYQKAWTGIDGLGSIGGVYARGALRYFPTDNLRLQLDASYSKLDIMTTTTVGAEARYQFDQLPVSVFAAYDFTKASASSVPEDLYQHQFRLGVSMAFGADSLKDQDRHGTSLDPYEATYSLPYAIVAAGCQNNNCAPIP
ncbi:MAG TPA: hypothetical protein VIL84_08330 [Devosiaceae bacterium]